MCFWLNGGLHVRKLVKWCIVHCGVPLNKFREPEMRFQSLWALVKKKKFVGLSDTLSGAAHFITIEGRQGG